MKRLYIYFLIGMHCIATTLLGHGFSADTSVLLVADNESRQQIRTICYRAQKKNIAIASYDAISSWQTTAWVVNGGRSKTNCYIRFGFEEQFKDLQHHYDIVCTPKQEFYLASTRQWAPADMLKVGDTLLCANNVTKNVAYISLIETPLDIYTIAVKRTHTFFVTQHSVLTHNMVLPLAFNIGLSIPFGVAAGGTAGSFFGPATFLVGAAVGCMIGALVKIVCDDNVPTYAIDSYDARYFSDYRTQYLDNYYDPQPQSFAITVVDGYENRSEMSMPSDNSIVTTPSIQNSAIFAAAALPILQCLINNTVVHNTVEREILLPLHDQQSIMLLEEQQHRHQQSGSDKQLMLKH